MHDIILLLKKNVVGYYISIYVVNTIIILPFSIFLSVPFHLPDNPG